MFKGNVLFLILIAVAMFAALTYAVTQSTGGGVVDISSEKSEMDVAKVENYEAAVNAALWRLKLANGCLDEEVSYETPAGDYENPLSPVDYRCHVFRPEGGGVPYTGFVPAGAVDNDPDSFAGNFNDLSGETSGTVVVSNSVVISGINVYEAVNIIGEGSPEYSINGGPYMSSGGRVKDGDTLTLRATSPAGGQTKNITVTVGEQSDVWSIYSLSTGSWTVDSWGSCSASCGGGTQTRSVTCEFDVCSGSEPDSSQSCNTQPCYTYSWYTSSWSGCNASCGGGTQSRTVYCRRNDGVSVSDGFCSGSKPDSTQSCNTQACSSGSWSTSSWSGCSASCGGGTQTRSVWCSYDNCTGGRPSSSRSCNTQSCCDSRAGQSCTTSGPSTELNGYWRDCADNCNCPSADAQAYADCQSFCGAAGIASYNPQFGCWVIGAQCRCNGSPGTYDCSGKCS